jgi:hypothetical protein
MRLALFVALVACSSKSAQREDLELFCSREAAAKATSFTALGEFLEPQLHDTEFREVFVSARAYATTDVDPRKALVRQLEAEHITSCPTLARLFAR